MKSRGGVPVVLLFLLLAAAAVAVLFFVRKEEAPAQSFAFSNYHAFRVVRGKLSDAALEDALLRTADRELRAHGLEARGEGLPSAADEIAFVVEPAATAPDRSVTVRLITSTGTEVWSNQLAALDAKSIRDITEANLAMLLANPRSERK